MNNFVSDNRLHFVIDIAKLPSINKPLHCIGLTCSVRHSGVSYDRGGLETVVPRGKDPEWGIWKLYFHEAENLRNIAMGCRHCLVKRKLAVFRQKMSGYFHFLVQQPTALRERAPTLVPHCNHWFIVRRDSHNSDSFTDYYHTGMTCAIVA